MLLLEASISKICRPIRCVPGCGWRRVWFGNGGRAIQRTDTLTLRHCGHKLSPTATITHGRFLLTNKIKEKKTQKQVLKNTRLLKLTINLIWFIWTYFVCTCFDLKKIILLLSKACCDISKMFAFLRATLNYPKMFTKPSQFLHYDWRWFGIPSTKLLHGWKRAHIIA